VLLHPPRFVAPLALGFSLLLSACHRDEVAHFRVAKSTEPPAAGGMGGGPMGGRPGMPPPGMDGDVPPPPAPDRGLAWTLPKGWTEERQGGMRYATLKAPQQGRIDASVVVLPGPAGGELPNVNRWRGQIGLPPIDEAALATARTALKTPAGAVSVYDFTSEGQKKSRLIAGLLEAGGSTWFVKVTGDAETVTAARADFLSLLGSLRLE
jgi:hypothetical protein